MPFGMGCRLWGRVCPFSLPPASGLWQGMGQSTASQLFSGIHSVLCSGNTQIVPKFRTFPRLILSLAIPQFKLLTRVSSLRLPSGHSGPVLTLSNATHTSLFSPQLLVVDASVWGTFLMGAVFRHVICGFYFPSQLDCPLRFENFPQTRQ